MVNEPQVSMYNLIFALSYAMDLINPRVLDHHNKVAYISLSIGKQMKLSNSSKNNLLIAGLLHDIGAFSLKERLDILKFEFDNPSQHAELGHRLLKTFEPFTEIAKIVRFHHQNWNHGEGAKLNGLTIPLESHILHLSDRISVSVKKDSDVLSQAETIRKKILSLKGKMFEPGIVDSFVELSYKECFWLDLISQQVSERFSKMTVLPNVEMDMDTLIDLVKLFAYIIDFRSPFTATHSSGVAASAEALAQLAGFSQRECKMLRMAGYLHDLGKLAVPKEILEKPAKLGKEEFNIIRGHTFYTYRILERIGLVDIINTGAAFHHEKLDGTGYPFHLDEESLSLQARIFAIADVFTAITEDRPYRKGMSNKSAMRVLKNMVKNSSLDPVLVRLLEDNFDKINEIRKKAQEQAKQEYEAFWVEDREYASLTI